jgi:hypothetical protein
MGRDVNAARNLLSLAAGGADAATVMFVSASAKSTRSAVPGGVAVR